MGIYAVCFATVPNDYKQKWQNQNDNLQAFQLVPRLGFTVTTVECRPAGLYTKKFEHGKRQKLDHYDLIVHNLIDMKKFTEIRTVGVGLPTQLKEVEGLGWDGDDLVFWRVFWQKCINEGVLELNDFKTRAREMYKLNDRQSNLTLADELKNAMKAMKSTGKGKERQVTTGSGSAQDTNTKPRERSRTRDGSKKWRLPLVGGKTKNGK